MNLLTSKIHMQNKNIIKYKSQTIFEVIKLLNNVERSILIFIDAENKLIGTLTDGDIRRGLLKKKSLEDDVIFAINKKPFFVNINYNYKKIVKKIIEQQLIAVPVLNNNGKLIDIIFDSSESNKIDNKFVIMAGGRGVRMKPITDKIPKSLVSYKGNLLISRIIDKAYEEGFRNFVISLGYLGHKIQKYLYNNYSKKINIEFTIEKKPLGTIGALSLINKTKLPFVVSNTDIITDVSYKDLLNFHKYSKADLTIGSKIYQIEVPFGVLRTNKNRIVQMNEKPKKFFSVNAGVYVFSSELQKSVPKNSFTNINNFFDKIKDKKKIISYPIYETWRDIGTLKDVENDM
jgi:dTDP-glucose pyrophosphorylase